MMKKSIIILLSLLFITGCSKVEYNLTIQNNDTIHEEIAIPYKKTEENQKMVDNMMSMKQLAFHSSTTKEDYYYNVNLNDIDKNTMLLTYTYDYGINNIINSEAINACFYQKDFIDSEDTFIIKTGNISCLKDEYQQIVDELTVTIRFPSNYKNVKNNADKVIKNQYIWYFNNNNYEDHMIDIEMKKLETIKKVEKNNDIWIVFGLIGVIVLIICIAVLKGKHNNKI